MKQVDLEKLDAVWNTPYKEPTDWYELAEAYPALRDELQELREFRDRVLAPTKEDVVVLSTRERKP